MTLSGDFAGVAMIIAGVVYRMPSPIQPMKAMMQPASPAPVHRLVRAFATHSMEGCS